MPHFHCIQRAISPKARESLWNRALLGFLISTGAGPDKNIVRYIQTVNSWGLALSWAVIHYPFMFSFRNTTSRETWPQGNLFQECVWPPSQRAVTVLPPLLVFSHHLHARQSPAITPTLPRANGKIFMHLTPINIQIVAVKWLSQGWGGSSWQSRVPVALCACLNTGVIFYWQGAASHPPVVARLQGCQKVCVCVCLFFHGEHQEKISIISWDQRHSWVKVWAAAVSRCGSGEVFAVGCSEAVSSWAHGRLGLADVEDLAVALSGSLWGEKGGKLSCMAACSWCVDLAW